MMNNKINIAAVITALLSIGMMMTVVDVANAQTTCGLLPAGTLPQNGAACTDALPEGKSSIGCGGESYTGTTRTDLSCTCNIADPTWKCVSTSTEIPPNNECPSQDSPPASGDSCAGLLVVSDSSQKCMFSRRFSSSADMETFNCTCSNAAGSTVDLWSCDGTFAPAAAPSMMPAGQVQPTSTSTVLKDADEDVDVSDMDVTDETATTTTSNSDDSGASSFINFKVMATVIVAVVATAATAF